MKVALVAPKSTFLTDAMVWPPLGLWYLGAQLERQNHKVDFFDLNMDLLPEDGVYDQMWISATSAQIAEVRRILNQTKDYKTKRVVGGSGAWADPMAFGNLDTNLVVSGESDHPETIKEILELAEGRYQGLYLPATSKTLDWVVSPIRRWSLRYHSYMRDYAGNQYRMASLFTTRGCCMSCAFCESGRNGVIWDNMVRYESDLNVERQIQESKLMGFTGLAYYDDIFPLNKNRTMRLMELHRFYEMKFRCFLRSDIICKYGKEYLQAMKDGGLIECFMGVESASNQIKKNIHKGTTIEQDEKVLRWCRELGITCKMSFILGLPGETLETMHETRKWILSQDPKGIRVQVDRLIPFKGTPLTKHPEEYDLNYENMPDDEWFFRGRMDMDSHSFVSTSHLSVQEIDAFWATLEFELKAKGYQV